jgi:uncharacterized membrane protein YeaQ/YmgE (transglycosylase-associated protein family)
MNKRVISFAGFLGLTVGSILPMVFGWDPTGLSGPSILGGLIGGIVAIWAAVKISKALNL